MPAPRAETPTCPICGNENTLVRHCTSETCPGWVRCDCCGAYGDEYRFIVPHPPPPRRKK